MLVFVLIHLKSSVVLANKLIVRVLGMSNSFYKYNIQEQNQTSQWMSYIRKEDSVNICVPQRFVLIVTEVTKPWKYFGTTS